MAHGYKLLGEIWDGMPVPEQGVACSEADAFCQIAGVPENLFDLGSYHRRLLLSTVFSQKTNDSLAACLRPLSKCDVVYLEADYVPSAKGKVP